MKLFRKISLFLNTYLVVLSASSCLYAESVTVAVANGSSYAVDRTIRFSKRCGMKAERVKSTNIDINKYDGLILPGGADVSPSRYGQKTKDRHTYGCNGKMDDFQITLVRMFAAANKPILGICRGCQVINVAFGGTLRQHVGWRKRQDKDKCTEKFPFLFQAGIYGEDISQPSPGTQQTWDRVHRYNDFTCRQNQDRRRDPTYVTANHRSSVASGKHC